MSPPWPRRGDVWLARLDKVRPVIVLTRDPMGRVLHAVITAPVTSTIRGVSTEVPVGRARPETMKALCAALATAVDCDR